MKITLVTHNRNKMKEFEEFLSPEIDLDVIDMEYPELRSDDAEDIVSLAASQLADSFGKTVIVEDSGFYINALSGFPGTCTAYVHNRIGNEGFVKIMDGVKDRRVFYKSAIAICKPGGKPKVFTGIERGTMARDVRGENGWGQDPIFIPEGSDRTYGESRSGEEGEVNVFRKEALKKLKSALIADTTLGSQ